MVEKPEEYLRSSYLATAGKAKPHPWLTTDWSGGGSAKRGKAEAEYRNFIRRGILPKTIWTEVRGQALPGEEGFVDQLVDHLKKQRDIPEIPRSQRYAHRPPLEKLVAGDGRTSVQKRRAAAVKAVEQYGYRVREIAAHLEPHDSLVSRIARGERLMPSRGT